jgi:hypothetical protein
MTSIVNEQHISVHGVPRIPPTACTTLSNRRAARHRVGLPKAMQYQLSTIHAITTPQEYTRKWQHARLNLALLSSSRSSLIYSYLYTLRKNGVMLTVPKYRPSYMSRVRAIGSSSFLPAHAASTEHSAYQLIAGRSRMWCRCESRSGERCLTPFAGFSALTSVA